ncbi:MAG: hypothetical protein K2W86_10090 [Sphingomonas sp.]|uniref:hypothetical protein n=1 Tax=Sphingomonas sp. TaxID=28214 RepID=UPI0035A916A0|nr:hypothetical protein [Sphingomonas sp.]
MPSLEEIEREYRALAARVTYAEFDNIVNPEESQRLQQLAEWRVELTAPDFRLATR